MVFQLWKVRRRVRQGLMAGKPPRAVFTRWLNSSLPLISFRIVACCLLAHVAVSNVFAAITDCKLEGGSQECISLIYSDWRYWNNQGSCPRRPSQNYMSTLEGTISEAVANAMCQAYGCSEQHAAGSEWITTGGTSAWPTQQTLSSGLKINIVYSLLDTPACGRNGTVSPGIYRGRTGTCPKGYSLWPAGDNSYCYATSTEQRPCPDGACTDVGNAISAISGRQAIKETDFTGSGTFPLAFERTYSSYSFPALPLVVRPVATISNYWRSNYENAIVLYKGTAKMTAVAYRSNGVVDYFYLSAGHWVGRTEQKATLVSTFDPNGDPVDWTYQTEDGTVEAYDQNGRLLAISNRTDNTHNLTYDAAGRLDAVTDSFGNRLTFSYNAVGHLSSMTDPAGHNTTYEYDSNGNLVEVAYADGTAKVYHHENAALKNFLTGISHQDAAGTGARYSTYFYDSAGRAISSEYAGGQKKYIINYDSATKTTVTDAANNKEVLTFTTNLGVKNLISKRNLADNKTLTQTFDANNNLACRQDEEGRVSTFIYSATNQKLSETRGRTGTCSAPVTTSATRTTTYAYLSPTLDLPTVIESPSVAGGSLKKRTEITYDATLRVPRVITQRGYTPAGAAVARTVTLDYNASGQVRSIDGPRTDVNDVTTLDYYECTTGRECGQLKRVTNALGQATTYDVYDASGRLIELTDPNGLKTFYGYDLRGRVLSVTVKAPDGSTHLTGYAYNAAGNLTEVRTPDGRVLTYTYDAAQDLKTVTDNAGNKVEYGYDLKGNRTATKTYDPQGTLVRSIELAFDARNRVKEINDGGSITRQVWDAVGNLTKVTDPNTVEAAGTAATVNEYDALNRLFKTTDRLSGLTQYGYDTGDRVKQVTAPNATTTGYAVDDLGNVIQETSPDRGVLTYGYDQAGNVVSLLDARGISIAYSYDALNRLTTADFPGVEEDLTYAYDTGCTNGIGRLCTVNDAAGASAYAYDSFGNLATHTRTTLGVSATTGYGYDPLNRVASITYPDGRKVDYTRNSLGQVTGVTLTQGGSTQTLASQLTYRADGLLAGLTTGNGVSESRLYTLAGRLESWTVGSETRGLIYDANGNLKERTGTATATFSYDALDRLKDESLNSFAQSFTYDPNGNRKSDALGSYDYLASTNRLSTTPTGAITLDAAGNLKTQGARTFGYYGSGQLRDITEGTLLAAYAYNSERQRTRKTVNNDTTVYHYDLAGNLLMETDAAGTPKKTYVWVNGRPLAILENGGIVYLHTDHLDTPRFATNAQGTVVWRWEGEAFGDTAANEDPDGDGTTTTVNLRFPGQYYDQETGLHYNWNRYYDPRLGRYVTSDPIGLEGGLNTYAYVRNNPLGSTDPLGLEPNEACVAACTVGGGLIGGGIGYVGGGLLGAGGGTLVAPGVGTVGGAVSGSKLGGALGAVAGSTVGNAAGQAMCPDDEKKCDLEFVREMPSYDGKTKTCIYKRKGTQFTFPQAVGYPCPPINQETCMVDTRFIMPPARY